MNKPISKKKCATAVAIAAAVASAFALTGCGDGIVMGGYIGMDKYDNADKYSVGNFTYSTNDVTSIDLDWVCGDVEFVVSENETLSVTETGDALDDDKKMHWYIDGTTLRIKFWKSGKGGKVDRNDKCVTVEIPKTLVTFEAENTSGKLVAQSIDANSCKVDTTSGDIELSSVTTDGRTEIESTSGDIKINELKASEAEVDTTSGDITVSSAEITGKYEVKTTSGTVNIGGINANSLEFDATSGQANIALSNVGNAKIETTSADVSLASAERGMEIRFDTTSGELISTREHTKSGNTYTFGDGACKITVETTSGDLTVR